MVFLFVFCLFFIFFLGGGMAVQKVVCQIKNYKLLFFTYNLRFKIAFNVYFNFFVLFCFDFFFFFGGCTKSNVSDTKLPTSLFTSRQKIKSIILDTLLFNFAARLNQPFFIMKTLCCCFSFFFFSLGEGLPI